MTRRSASPPVIAAWLVNLVAAPEQAETILGDLLEEFSSIISRSGTRSARRWYWRQSIRTIADLMRGQVRHAPTQAVAFAVCGFLLFVLVERVLQMSAQAVVAHSRVYYHVNAIAFWQTIDDVGRFVLPAIVGWTIARAARGREMMAVLSVVITETVWIFAIYTNSLLANLGRGSMMNIPDFSMASMFCPPASGPPHGPSVMNTLNLMRFTLVHWLIPTVVLMLVGAATRRTTSSRRMLGRETTQ